MVDYFYDLGIHHIWTDPLFSSVGNLPVCISSKKSPHIDLNTYADNYIAAYKYAQKKAYFGVVFYVLILMANHPITVDHVLLYPLHI